MIERIIKLDKYVKKGMTLILFGARRTGKTTLINQYIENNKISRRIAKFNGDNLSVQNNFSQNDITHLSKLVDGYDTLIIDEAQNVKNIGQSLKILNDERPELEVIVSGSSSFELRGQIGEPLVGRKTTLMLFPFSVEEVLAACDTPRIIAWQNNLKQYLVYGLYPNSVIAKTNKEREKFLLELVDSLLIKDILTFRDVKGSDVILKLLRLLAFQIGNEVSMEELGNSLGISKNTVVRYLDLLEKAFVIFRLDGFSRNLRNEINKKSKYYFYDVGVRNALINNFNSLELRDDIGKLWENFVIVERKKQLSYAEDYRNLYFWRTWEGKEIDLVEEKNGKFTAFEMKWNEKKDVKIPQQWVDEYGETDFDIVNPENFLQVFQIDS